MHQNETFMFLPCLWNRAHWRHLYCCTSLWWGVQTFALSCISSSPHLSPFCFGLRHKLGAGRCFFLSDWFFFREGYSGWKAAHLLFLAGCIIASPSEQKAVDTCSILLIGLKGYSENGWTDEMSPSFRESRLHDKKPEVIIQLDFGAPTAFISFYFIFYSFQKKKKKNTHGDRL